MIKYVQGDILHSKAEAIAQGVAPGDDFKQGLALSLREQWPAMYKDFRHFCKVKNPSEGELWTWKGAGGPMVINLFTQEHNEHKSGYPGRATLQHVNHALKNLNKEIQEQGLKSLALPKLATGVGGLSWSEVKALIEQHLSGIDIPIYIYEEFHKGQMAEEN